MKMTSEFVSIGHPDRTCDFISSYILDHYLSVDPKTRYAVEVQMKDNCVTLGGEITSTAKFKKLDRELFVRNAVAAVGYDAKYAELWGRDNVPCADDLKIVEHLSEQSPDIAQGVDREGWGDQGIFWGMAVKSPSTDDMPLDHTIARKLAERIYAERLGGIDIKTQVEVEDGRVTGVIAPCPAAPRTCPTLSWTSSALCARLSGGA